jgi:hypothetical protein
MTWGPNVRHALLNLWALEVKENATYWLLVHLTT